MDGGDMAGFKAVLVGAAPLALAIVSGGLALLPAAGPAQARSTGNPQIMDICRHTMRTVSGTSDEGACIESLTATAAFISKATATQQARQACEAQGISDQGAAMAMCMVDRRDREASPALSIDPGLIRTSAKSYTRMNFKDQHQAEEQSCATLGLQPDTAGFQSCVASLDAALFDADNPQS
jgi:hypothetical protein